MDQDDRQEKALRVLELVENFAKEQQIRSSETIYQCDWVIENAYEFIDKLVETAGAFQQMENV